MNKLTLATFFIFYCLSIANGQDFVIGERITTKSEILNEDRNILVYLPKSYATFSQKYPVMYILDGTAHFHHATGIVQYLSSRGFMPEMIVVAIVNVDRTRDFSPSPERGYPNTGGAPKFMSYINEELIPYVEMNYRTEPYRMIVGHSLGGTFATYALVNFPNVFDGYIAISPFLHYQNGKFLDEAENKLGPTYRGKKQYFMTVGNESQYFKPLDRFSRIIEEKMPGSFDFSYVQMLDEDHFSVPHISIYRGLQYIYSGWELDPENYADGIDYIDKQYKKLSKKYGYNVQASESTINSLGYYFFRKGEMENAIETFRENVKRFPNSPNAYDSLGEVYESIILFQEAEKNYKKAAELAAEMNHPGFKNYTDNLKRIQKKLNP